METLQLQVVHRIPGRMRLALPAEVPLRDLGAAAETLRRQAGVQSVSANSTTRRLLVLHDGTADLSAFVAPEPAPPEKTEEPEGATTEKGGARLTAAQASLRDDLRSSLPAGGLLAAALAKNYLFGAAGRVLALDYAAVAATGYSVLRHGGGDLSQRLMHPDTIASILLLVATRPPQLVGAALVMWVLNIAEIVADHLQQETKPTEERQESTAVSAPTNPLLAGAARAAARVPGGLGEQIRALIALFR